jgi:hypothetical protein
MLSSISSLIINVYVYKTNVNRIIFKKHITRKERRNKEKYNHILKKQSFIISKKIMVDFGLICNGLNIEKNQ